MRIISLVPSITDLLFDLHLNQEVVGITKFCVHPENWRNEKTIIGGTKNLNTEAILKLAPDMIFANKEENVKEQVEELGKKFRVVVTDVADIPSAFSMILELGRITSHKKEAVEIVRMAADEQWKLSIQKKSKKTNRAAYLIWNNPMMTVGSDTFIHHMMKEAGFENVFENSHRYPETNEEELFRLRPEYILLSSEPFPFSENHRLALAEKFPASKVILVNGEMFSWYGSRMIKAFQYFKENF